MLKTVEVDIKSVLSETIFELNEVNTEQRHLEKPCCKTATKEVSLYPTMQHSTEKDAGFFMALNNQTKVSESWWGVVGGLEPSSKQ